MSGKSKAEKLISRGSETPEVAKAAEHISEMLTRLYLNQPRYFAEAIARAVPGFTTKDSEKLRDFFYYVAAYFEAEALGRPYPDAAHREQIRKWGLETDEGCYNIHRVFCVLACGLPYCVDKPDCWETRRAFCDMDAPKS